MTDTFDRLSKLGQGAMGVVWRARNQRTGEVVALKVMHGQFADDADYLARFEHEVEMCRRIDSPNVVGVRGYGAEDGVPFLAMELVEGQSLREVIRDRVRLPWPEARGIVRQAAQGLQAAHLAGVVHRDVKPSNILVMPDRQVKLADFGIARAADLTRLTGSQTMLGTLPYMPPEASPDHRGDLYCLGVVLYELLTGVQPFRGEMGAVLAQHLTAEPDLAQIPDGRARSIVAWLMQKDPARRPQDAAALVAVLFGSTPPPNVTNTGAARTGAPGRGGGWRPTLVVPAFAAIALLGSAAVAFALLSGGGIDDGGVTPPVSGGSTVVVITATPTRAPSVSPTPTPTFRAAETPPPTDVPPTAQPSTVVPPTTQALTTASATMRPPPTAPPTAGPPTAVPTIATVTTPTADRDGDGVADVADACPSQAGSWLQGCAKPPPPALIFEVRSGPTIRMMASIPMADRFNVFLVAYIGGLQVFTSVPQLSQDNEMWYADIATYQDEHFQTKVISYGEAYCIFVRAYYQPLNAQHVYTAEPPPSTFLQLTGSCVRL